MLTEAKRKEILSQLPDINSLHRQIIKLNPEFISIIFGPNNTIPVSAVCLRDCSETLHGAHFALFKAFEHKILADNKKDESEILGENFCIKFYCDDVALRLYAASEHLAFAIKNMLEISEKDLKPCREKRSSTAIALGKYLIKEKETHIVTESLKRLVESREWHNAMHYRNDWVHEQPPLVSGQGLVHKRILRWEKKEVEIPNNVREKLNIKEKKFNHVLTFTSSGDEPIYSLENLLSIMTSSLERLFDTTRIVLDQYLEILNKTGNLLS